MRIHDWKLHGSSPSKGWVSSGYKGLSPDVYWMVIMDKLALMHPILSFQKKKKKRQNRNVVNQLNLMSMVR